MKTCLVERVWLILSRGTKRTVLAVNACNLWAAVFLSAFQFTCWHSDLQGDYLVFGSVPVMNQPCRDKKAVIHMAGAAVVPSTVAAHLGFPIGQTYGALTTYRKEKGESLGLYTSQRYAFMMESEEYSSIWDPFQFSLFYPRDISHSIKNWEINISILGLALKKHTLTWLFVTNSWDSSQKILSTSQETKAEGLLVRHWAFKSHGHLKNMVWSLARPHSTVSLLQRVPIFLTTEWASTACLQECKPAPADSQKGCWLGR